MNFFTYNEQVKYIIQMSNKCLQGPAITAAEPIVPGGYAAGNRGADFVQLNRLGCGLGRAHVTDRYCKVFI